MGLFTRWLAAFGLLALSFNPTPYNYLSWVRVYGEANMSLAVLVGLMLVVGYIIFLRATVRSIGVAGMCLVLAVFGAMIWVLHDFGLLKLDNRSVNLWLGLLALSLVLGVGLGWSHVRRSLTGQADMDDVDE